MSHKKMYSTKRWRQLRLKIIKAQPICVLCSKRPTTVVDHIIPHKGDEGLMWQEDNLRGCCKPCHDSKTSRIDSAHTFGRWKRIPDFIKPPRMPVTLVCGAEGSGRSEYIQRNADSNDVIIDPVEIASNLSGLAPHRADMDKWLTPTMLARNDLLAKLCVDRRPHAWVVIPGARIKDRRAWRELLRANVVVMGTPLDVCIERITHSPRYDKPMSKRSAKKWWQQYAEDFDESVVYLPAQ